MHRTRACIIALVCLSAAVGIAYSVTHHIRIRDAVNPSYWARRISGRDLFDPETGLLYRGNPERREIALTIDDGPHSPMCEQILDILKDHNFKATFFVVGENVKKRPDLVRRMAAEGHEIANHTQTHYRLDTLAERHVRNEIVNCATNVKRAAGIQMTALRPPGMRYNDQVLRTARDLGYVVVHWTSAAKDFEDVTPDYIVDRVLRSTNNGSILLLHDDRPSTVIALPRVLSALKREGYRFVTITEMMNNLPERTLATRRAAARR